VRRRLREAGCRQERRDKGDHEFWFNRKTKRRDAERFLTSKTVETATHMSAWRSTPGSAQERCARRALVNSLDGSVGTFCAAETQPGDLAPPFQAAMTCNEGSWSSQEPLWNGYLGNPGLYAEWSGTRTAPSS
jgi:hypothetical protein